MADVRFDPELKKHLSELVGQELDTLIEVSTKPLRESIRINTLKTTKSSLLPRLEQHGWSLRRIPWSAEGYWVEGAPPNIGNTIEHALGLYYVQGGVSMAPVEVLDPKPHELALDLCAAPGSKATQISQKMQNMGAVVANDSDLRRIRALSANIQKIGAINCTITNVDGRMFPRWGREMFDKVIVDAPCSATGIIRKSWEAARRWSPRMVKGLSRVQTSLLSAGFDCVKPGGVVVYATCSLSPEENERVVNRLLDQREDAKLFAPELQGLVSRKGIPEWKGEVFRSDVQKTMRIYPQDNDAEGFFISKVVKAG